MSFAHYGNEGTKKNVMITKSQVTLQKPFFFFLLIVRVKEKSGRDNLFLSVGVCVCVFSPQPDNPLFFGRNGRRVRDTTPSSSLHADQRD